MHRLLCHLVTAFFYSVRVFTVRLFKAGTEKSRWSLKDCIDLQIAPQDMAVMPLVKWFAYLHKFCQSIHTAGASTPDWEIIYPSLIAG